MLGNLHVRFGVGAGVIFPGLHHRSTWDSVAQPARFNATMGRCLRPALKLTSSVSFAPGLPRTSAQGFAQGDPRSQRERGSKRGRRLAENLAKYTSLGVLPPSYVCVRDSLYHATISVSSRRNASRRRWSGLRILLPSILSSWFVADRNYSLAILGGVVLALSCCAIVL